MRRGAVSVLVGAWLTALLAATAACGTSARGPAVASRGAAPSGSTSSSLPASTTPSPSTPPSPSESTSSALIRLGRHTVYAALGDSYSAGPLIPPQTAGRCLRSGDDYAGLLARAMRVRSVRDVTCSGATTADLAGTQAGSAGPQFAALSRHTTLVTVGIGGNDVGLIGLAKSCLSLVRPPSGSVCATRDGGRYASRIRAFAPTYGRVVRAIRRRSPHARILLVGYPTAIRAGGCWPAQPVLPADATYLQSTIDQLNAAMARQARRNGAQYVDLALPSRGHDVCAAPGQRWLNGVLPSADAFPLHPNVLEMRDTERVIARLLVD